MVLCFFDQLDFCLRSRQFHSFITLNITKVFISKSPKSSFSIWVSKIYLVLQIHHASQIEMAASTVHYVLLFICPPLPLHQNV